MGRSGADRRNTNDLFYATGNLDPGASDWLNGVAWAADSTSVKAYIGHANQLRVRIPRAENRLPVVQNRLIDLIPC